MNQNRNYLSLLLLSLCLLVCSSLPAQIRLAAWGGIHSSNLSEQNSIPGYDTAYGKYYSSKTGFELGVLAEIPLGKYNLYFQPGIMYSAKGNQYEKFYDSSGVQTDTLYDQHTLSLNYVQIPLYLTWKIPISRNQRNQFYISAGPYFSFIYSVSSSYENRVLPYNSQNYVFNTGTEDHEVGNGPDQYKTLDLGICTKAGFELGNLMLGAYFSHGFTNAYTAHYPSTFHNQVFGGSLGIWLNNPKTVPQAIKDQDNDGTADIDDSCKTIPGPPKYHGCPIPDSDLDGVNDEQDSCKTIAGLARYHGCPIPDTDRDGVNDEQDSCKTIAGTEKYHGCPIPDHDGDGLNDELDQCPDQAGPADNKGCPILKMEIIQKAQLAADNVLFQSNSARLKKSSLPGLRVLADSLKSNQELDILIEGHTDNIGSPVYNLQLSIDRAESVKKELIKLGINESHISVKGFGDTRPLADNKSALGKAKNRRVVFIFHINNR